MAKFLKKNNSNKIDNYKNIKIFVIKDNKIIIIIINIKITINIKIVIKKLLIILIKVVLLNGQNIKFKKRV